MPRIRLLLVAWSLAACTATSIEGQVIVGPGDAGIGVVAVLWQNQLRPLDPDDPNSPVSEQPVVLAQQAVGTTTKDGAKYPFIFHSVAKGKYLVGAYADFNRDGEITDDEISIDLFAPPLEIDPDDPGRTTASRDVYMRMSAPDRVTLSGVLRRSPLAAARATHLLVLDAPLSDPDANIVGRQTISAGGLDVPWKLFNAPPGRLHVVAFDDFSLRGLVSIHPGNPLVVELEGSREITGIDVWMDRQAPHLGSVSGEVRLNASLPGTSAQLLLFDADPTDPALNPRLVGWVNAPATSLSVPFKFVSMPLKKLYLGGAIITREPGGRELSTTRIYRLGKEPTPLLLTAEQPEKNDIVFPMGVGRVSGSISVQNATKGLGLWVFAMVDGATSPEPQQYDVFASPSDGDVVVPYVMFGLEDGEYRMQLVPDTTGVDGPNDELAQVPPFVFDGAPAQIEIVGGSRAASNFNIKLGATP